MAASRGAGRPPRGPLERGAQNPAEVEAKNVLHVVLRRSPRLATCASAKIYQAIRAASRTAARRGQFRIVHLSIQRTHLHLLVEARTSWRFARGMQGFQISAPAHQHGAWC